MIPEEEGISWDERQTMSIWEDMTPNAEGSSRSCLTTQPKRTFFKNALNEAVQEMTK